jgi:hypothetical protein
MALCTLELAATVLFSLTFVPIFLTEWRREGEHWRRREVDIAQRRRRARGPLI